LQGPITIVLSIAEPDAGDLDLLLADTAGTILKESVNTGALERIETDPGQVGEFLIAVSAYAGASNYVLSLGLRTAAMTMPAVAPDHHVLNSDAEFVIGEVIMQLKTPAADTAPQAQLASILTSAGLFQKAASPNGARLLALPSDAAFTTMRRQAGNRAFPLHYASAEQAQKARTLEAIKTLRRDAAVAYAEPNYINHINMVPNDEYFNLQWYYNLINLPQAWDMTQGDDAIVVAVIDTGVVTTHPDLAGRLLHDANGAIMGYDFIENSESARDGDGIDPDPFDVGDLFFTGIRSSFHGTHVAGTIAADTNNTLGVAGVTWQGKIMPLRVLGLGGGTDFDMAQAILYASGAANSSGTVPPVKANVINMSLGPSNPDCQPLPPLSQTTVDALTVARDAGVIVVVAAGNDGCNVPTPMSTFEGVISVGAVDLRGDQAFYSNGGTTLDVTAPGGDVSADRDGNGLNDGVLSTLADDSGGTIQYKYELSQGTSMAAPHMAGVVALMLAVNPILTSNDINGLLAGTHPDPQAGAITRDLGVPGRDDAFGYGLIDAFQAVDVARHLAGGGGGTPPPPGAPVLVVTPESLNFDAATTSLPLLLSNTGTTPLEVTSVTADVPWIAIDQTAYSTLTVTVDRTGLPNGTSLGHITIVSNGGTLTVPVSVQVQSGGAGGDVGTLYVLVVNSDTLDTVAQAVTRATEAYVFLSPDFAAGRYHIVAGSDRDNDGFICDSGEACGAYPLIDSPTPVDVDGAITGIDFPVSFPFSVPNIAAITASPSQRSSGFKRLAIKGVAR
jgi:serine protease